METSITYLQKTTFDEIANDLDELPLYHQLYFSSLDPEELKELDLDPYEYYIVEKVHFNFQNDEEYSVLIRHMNGQYVELKGIDILSDNNTYDEDERIYGIKEFLKEYYEKYMSKNSTNDIYYFCWNDN